jgi:hypothetical protein
MMAFETAFTMDTSSIKFGPGVTREVGHDMARYGVRRVMVVTDPNLADSEAVQLTANAPSNSARCRRENTETARSVWVRWASTGSPRTKRASSSPSSWAEP